MKDGPLELYLQRCQQGYEKQQLGSLQKRVEATEYRLENPLYSLADDLLPLETIRQKYGREEAKKRQWEHRLSELK